MDNIKQEDIEDICFNVSKNIILPKFKNLSDFINRVNSKDINKLQLEGLVKAGAFDSMNENRKSLFKSIPNFISKSKNFFENRSANQIDLFGETQDEINDIIFKINDWEFEERLSKEFEAVGFFISDHPLNQYREVFEDYKIINYQKFVNNAEIKDTNIAVTLLKIQERKTSKGNYLPDVHLHSRKQVSNLCKQGIRQRARECPGTVRPVQRPQERRSVALKQRREYPKRGLGIDTSVVHRNSRRPPRIQRRYPSRATTRRDTPSGIQLQPHSLATTRPIH